jgi:choline dehydrogenase-like flavoprotein
MGCGHCTYYGCEFGAKSSSLVTVIPKAVATGRCEVRTEATVFRVETDARGRATGVVYWDRERRERRQTARAVIVAANGAETARLLLNSTSPRFPHGLANASGMVGQHIMFNGGGTTYGLFEHPLNEHKGHLVSRILLDYYDTDPKRGFYGGGGIDARLPMSPINFALTALPDDVPTWGPEYARALREYYTHTVQFAGHATTLPVASNAVSLDPTHTDAWGRPSLRLTFVDHPDDMRTRHFLQERARELLEAAGATRVWPLPIVEITGGVHLLGTARMGNDARDSVVDRFHRAHDVPNLFVCDGSSFVTSGRGQPTLTIQALAFRAAEHIARFARSHEI